MCFLKILDDSKNVSLCRQVPISSFLLLSRCWCEEVKIRVVSVRQREHNLLTESNNLSFQLVALNLVNRSQIFFIFFFLNWRIFKNIVNVDMVVISLFECFFGLSDHYSGPFWRICLNLCRTMFMF